MQTPYVAEGAAAVNSLRDNLHLAGTGDVVGGVWYYPPTVLDENGRLWGSYVDHANRVLENRAALRCYYRSLQPDAPVPPPPQGRDGHVAAVETFVTELLAYYRPLIAAPATVPSELIAQTSVLLAEANVLYNVVLAMRPWTDVTAAAAAAAAAEVVSGHDETA